MSRLGREKSEQALAALDAAQLWLFVTEDGSDPASRLVFDAAVSGRAAFMLRRGHGVLALVANYDAGHVERLGVFDQIRSYERSFTDALRDWLVELAPGEILLNFSETDHLSDGLTHGQFLVVERLVGQALGAVPVSSSAPLLTRVRGVKTAEELRRLRVAIDGSVELYRRLRPRLAVGQSEREIQATMHDIAAELGLRMYLGDYGGPLVLVARAGIAHRPPGDDRLEPGDTLIIDHGLAHEGYHSDVARTFYVRRPGETAPPEPQRRVFDAVHRAIGAAFDAVRPGRFGWQVDAAARETLLGLGYPEITHATGHQVGRNVHDGGATLAPRWERYGQGPHLPLEAGQVFTLEPTVLQAPAPSALVEENIVVTADGALWLTERQDELWVI
jgi:Xaa-Pro aminopeptidase